jgi:hypothetical protein
MFYRNEWYDNREQILRGWGRRMPDLNAPILAGLLLCGIFGAAGQIIRAVVALGGSQTLTNAGANQQSLFNAAYFVVTLIIGFVAGLLAGLVALKTIAQPWATETALAAIEYKRF